MVRLLSGIAVAVALAGSPTTAIDGDWFSSTAQSIVRENASRDLPGVASNRIDDLKIGDPVTVEQESYQVAPILLDGTPVGTIATDFAGTEVITNDEYFADTVAAMPRDGRIVVFTELGGAEDLGGWFLRVDGLVSPLDPVARSVLAGPVGEDDFETIRESFGTSAAVGTGDSEPGKEQAGSRRIVLYLGVVVGVLAAVTVVLAVRRRRRNAREGQAHDRATPPGNGGRIATISEETVRENE
ncbi:hypothetical protein [Actinobaculum sp. 313]|uniref:hypothetical protein n=1 Tax=Actinobaculum sp. 313 TaxID=2495645 RepID=UPI000D52A469|nr:hypothetical protein [Actinobaculum sp. 313]AWE42038.1 hypothetical protein DDD63_03870 [Actinobaculum sp. 313]